jgi:hypothetical protein
MRQIESRIKNLAGLLAAKPIPTPEQPIIDMALQLTSSEDLMVLRGIIKTGRPLLASTEQESRALAAYHSAVEKAIGLMNDNLKRRKIHRLNRPSFEAVNKDRHLR